MDLVFIRVLIVEYNFKIGIIYYNIFVFINFYIRILQMADFWEKTTEVS